MSRKIDHKMGDFFLARSDSNPGNKKVREKVLILRKRSPDDYQFKSCINSKTLDCGLQERINTKLMVSKGQNYLSQINFNPNGL